MFELIFGIFWTAFSSVFVLAMNGEGAEEVPFFAHAMIWLFVAIGVVLIVVGLRKILANIATSTKGEETYGIVVDVYPSGTRVNGRPVLNADVEIVESNGMIGRYTESIGMSHKYRVGDFVEVKYYNNDINILGRAADSEVPYDHRERLIAESGIGASHEYSGTFNQRYDNGSYGYKYNAGRTSGDDTVIINGVEYTRKR